jgi:hypothetical protein
MESFKLDHLTEDEMANANGGFWQYVAGALAGALLTSDLGDLGDAFMEGYNAGRS